MSESSLVQRAIQVVASATVPTPSASPSPTTAPISDAEQQERVSSLALFLVLSLLILSFCTSYYLKVKRITAVHETIVGLFAGMLVGLGLRIGPGEHVQKMLSFSNTIMLNVLLPPIILSSGYDLRQENFFRNFGTILIFAFAGTFISAVVIGVIVYVWSLVHLESISLTFLECLIFGSTLSATDPVTILSIFNAYKVDPKLYSVIFGESLLNDAVSIVMFDTLSTFRGKDITVSSVFYGIGLFLIVFTLSMFLGICFGLGCSLLLKHSRLSSHSQLESCLVALIAYTSYFFSNGVTMSGIVSLLFCGITLKHYAYHNMSRRTQRATRYTFQTLSSLSENFIFIYLGLSLFTQEFLVYKPLFIIVTVFAVMASRYAAVFPIAALINLVKWARNRRFYARTAGGGPPRSSSSSDDELPREYQIMLFWAGLRGAVGFALSAGIEGQNAVALQTTVLVTVVLTVIVFGGTTAQMLQILGIRTGVQDDEGDSDDEEAEQDAMRLRGIRQRAEYMESGSYRYGRGGSSQANSSGSTRWKNESTSHLTKGYRDVSDTLSPHVSPGINHSYYGDRHGGPRASGDGGGGDEFDEEVRSSISSELLPSRTGTPAPNTSSPSAAQSLRPSPTVNTTSIPTLSEIGKAVMDLNPSPSSNDPSGTPSAKQLLDRAGLVLKDGQWFQAIDQKYLLPLFSNSVASRKHEEKKTARLAARGLDPLSESASSPSKSRASYFAFDDQDETNNVYPSERDAEIIDEDDGEIGDEVVFDATTFSSGTMTRNSSGANTPVRRSTPTKDNSFAALQGNHK